MRTSTSIRSLCTAGAAAFAVCVPVLLIAGVASAGGNAQLTRISSDPLTNTNAQHATQAYADTYSYGRVIVSVFAQGLSTVVSGGSSGVGFATSDDGGQTWIHGSLPGVAPGGRFSGVVFPAVAYDRKHRTWLISVVAAVANPAAPDAPPPKTTVLVSRSADGGQTWSQPVTVAQAHSPVSLGKPWITCDTGLLSPHYGNCYAEFWSHNNAGGKKYIQMSTSADGGRTWSAAQGTADHATATAGAPLVQPDGTVVVLMDNWIPARPSTQVRSFESVNGGKSWGPSHPVAQLHGAPSPLNSLGSFDIALSSAAVDGTDRIYAVWPDCRFRPHCTGNDIVLSTSSNGITWSKVTRVTSTGNDGFPGIGADPLSGGRFARLGITYYSYSPHCRGSNCSIDVRFISSADSGAIWSRPVRMAGPMRGSWLAKVPQGQGLTGVTLGSYIGTTILPGGNAVTAFPLVTAPTGSKLHQDMYTVRGGMPLISP
jgi:hypothetical protein